MKRLPHIAFILGMCIAQAAVAQEASVAVRSELAPGGSLRVGLNLTNTTTVTKDPNTGELRGVAVDLSRALADALGARFEPVLYPSAPKLTEGARAGQWDIAFLAIDPARSQDIAFTSAYMEVHNSYMVPPGSAIQKNADVDQPGIRIAVHERNATDLFLSRNLRHATLVRVASESAALDALRTGQADVLATGRGLLLEHASRWPNARVLDGWLRAVGHGIGVPAAREGAHKYLRDFVEQAKRSGRVQQMLDRQAVLGVVVAPAVPATGLQ